MLEIANLQKIVLFVNHDCNFNDFDNSGEANDETFCNWSQVKEDDLDWVLMVDPEEEDKGYIQL